MKKMYAYVMLLVSVIFSCTDSSNLLVGAGKKPDFTAPQVTVTSPSNNALVKGKIAIRGTTFDDMGCEKIEVYHVSSSTSEKLIGSTKVKNETFNYVMDTTVFEDGVNLFKIKVIERDPAKKSGITNLSLILDNYGPFVIINQPESNSPSQPIQNRFNCAILPLDYELNKVTNVEWRIQSLEDENNFLEGNKSLKIIRRIQMQVSHFKLIQILFCKKNGINQGFMNYKCGAKSGWEVLKRLGYH